MVDFIDELKWRGLIHDSTPGLQEYLKDSKRTAYIGFDPTSDSLHIGSLVPIILLAHFQKSGHQPIALVGGATGMIGDPSGKSIERNLLDEETLRNNENGIKKQLSQFLSFDEKFPNHAMIKNNYDWMKEFSFLDFIRDIGKHITVNYMMSKDSVKNRIDSESGSGMSFTEFTYQLVQGYDFLFLNRNFNCSIQMGGSDQWGNITTGMELIRRIDNGKGYALTCPLMTKSRKAGANPMSGCLPGLLQIPVFYAVFMFIPSAFDLRQKSFLWADDLSAYDSILDFGFYIPLYGDHVSLFPILASVSIFFYMKMTTGQQMASQPQPQEGMPDMTKMMKYMIYFAPIMMMVFFNNYSSGLSLYYFVSNLLSIGIMFTIKNYILDEQKIRQQIQFNKSQPVKPPSRFQRKMQAIMDEAERQKKNKQ